MPNDTFLGLSIISNIALHALHEILQLPLEICDNNATMRCVTYKAELTHSISKLIKVEC